MNTRALSANDYTDWLPLWQEYLRFYQTDLAPEVTQHTWLRLTGAEPDMQALGAFDDTGCLCGMVHVVFHPNTWDTRPSCYLEDLYVAQHRRRHGYGRALIEAVYALAATRRCCRVYWVTQADNHTAQRLYEHMAERTDFIQYRADWHE